MLYVGIDMSLSSPGLAACRDGVTHLLGFQQRHRDVPVADAPHGALRVTIAAYPLAEKNRWARAHAVVSTAIAWIRALAGEGTPVHAYIEGYALGMTGSASVSSLCELGGILRYALWQNGWTFSELAPSTVKKHFAGNGRADKPAMLAAYLQRGHTALDALVVGQHPQEDMVDALAILTTGRLLAENPHTQINAKKRKTAKRAKTDA